MSVTTLEPRPAKYGESDDSLLHRCATADHRAALAELIDRYAGMVHSAARRQTRDADLADDVAQTVFVIFARRCRSIRPAALPAWLLQTTRYTAANAMKSQSRRRRHEQSAALAAAASQQQSESRSHWDEIEYLIDAAITHLAQADQTAVILRYFQGHSFAQVAAVMGTTEHGARKRINRALHRLRKYLTAAGAPAAIAIPGNLSALLTRHGPAQAPAHVLIQAKAAAAGAAAFRIAGSNLLQAQVSPPPPAAAPSPPATEPAATFQETYILKPDENFKWIPTPPIAERRKWLNSNFPGALTSPDPDNMILVQTADGTLKVQTYFLPNRSGPLAFLHHGQSLRLLARALTDPRPWEMQGDDNLLSLRITGDGVFRDKLATADLLQNLADVASTQTRKKVVFTRDTVEHDMIVSTPSPTAGAAFAQGRTVVVNIQIPDTPLPGNGPLGQFFSNYRSVGHAARMGPINTFLDQLSDRTGYWFMDDSPSITGKPTQYDFTIDGVPYDGKTPEQQRTDLLDSLNQNTGLLFKRETRNVQIWNWQYSKNK
jgi:RNA polymerase sigma factor (sigma-70 family)